MTAYDPKRTFIKNNKIKKTFAILLLTFSSQMNKNNKFILTSLLCVVSTTVHAHAGFGELALAIFAYYAVISAFIGLVVVIIIFLGDKIYKIIEPEQDKIKKQKINKALYYFVIFLTATIISGVGFILYMNFK
ncbi:MAG: hypothetical protein P8Y24_06850 [Gammaproteobacteria bacterium]